jgi:hypothetical protein
MTGNRQYRTAACGYPVERDISHLINRDFHGVGGRWRRRDGFRLLNATDRQKRKEANVKGFVFLSEHGLCFRVLIIRHHR